MDVMDVVPQRLQVLDHKGSKAGFHPCHTGLVGGTTRELNNVDTFHELLGSISNLRAQHVSSV